MHELMAEKEAIRKASRLGWIHWVVVLGSIAITLTAWQVSENSIRSKANSEFDRAAGHYVELVIERMRKYEDALWSGVAHIQSTGGNISYPLWKAFADTLKIDERYPGINGIGIIYSVSDKNLENFIARQRSFQSDFSIHPTHQRHEYLPITYIEPIEKNIEALGLDMAHEKNRYQAALRARDSGMAQVTGPIILVQDEERTPGFLLYAPFYRDREHTSPEIRKKNFQGMVYAPFVFKKLMAGTLHTEKRRVNLKITDENEVLYDEGIVSKGKYQKTLVAEVYGRSWKFDISSTKNYDQSQNSNQPLLILIGGIIIDALLISIFIILAQANKRAYSLIQSITG